MKRSWLMISVVTLALIFFWSRELLQNADAIVTTLGWNGSAAIITVQTPAVHTRERLMNDRFEQVAWLHEQLEATTKKGAEKTSATEANAVSAAATKAAQNTIDKSGSPSDVSKQFVNLTSVRNSITEYRKLDEIDLQRFHSINSYRDIVRAERAIAMLDDRHDLDGNELYFLSFDTTILPGAARNLFGAVEIFLAPDAKQLEKGPMISKEATDALSRKINMMRSQDLVDIYFDWLERSENDLRDEIKINQQKFMQTGRFVEGSEEPKTILRTLICVEWTIWQNAITVPFLQRKGISAERGLRLVREACHRAQEARHTPGEEFEAQALDVSDVAAGSSTQIWQSAVSVARELRRVEYLTQRNLAKLYEAHYRREVDFKIKDLRSRPTFKEATSRCAVPGVRFGSFEHYILKSFFDRDIATFADDHGGIFFLAGKSDVKIWCPKAVVEDEILVVLANILQSMLDERQSAELQALMGGSLTIARSGNEVRISPEDSECASDGIMTYNIAVEVCSVNKEEFSQIGPNLTYSVIRLLPKGAPKYFINDKFSALQCMAALAAYDRMNSEGGQLIPGRGERMNDYFRLVIRPRESSMDGRPCSISLIPKLRANHWRRVKSQLQGVQRQSLKDQERPTAEEDSLVETLQARLDTLASDGSGTTESRFGVMPFSYALSPRLRHEFSMQKDRRDNLAGDSNGIGIGSTSEDRFSGNVSESAVIGFTPGLRDHSGAGGSARFGWVISPERSGKPWERELHPQELQLGALVAVPSWWRTAVLRICTGLVSGTYLPKLTSAESPLNDCRLEILRLPGTAQDVPRRLGVAVIKFPFLTAASEGLEARLQSGKSGKLLLEGGRLWRSTVVMLGAQRADRIEVLPDMQGISAIFDCVESPSLSWNKHGLYDSSNQVQLGDQEYAVPIRVWTSEGATKSESAFVRIKVDPSKACPGEGSVAESKIGQK